MLNIKQLINFIKKGIYNFNSNNVNFYRQEKNYKTKNIDTKYIEKRLYINEISMDSIVSGRITILVPTDLIKSIHEIVVISE